MFRSGKTKSTGNAPDYATLMAPSCSTGGGPPNFMQPNSASIPQEVTIDRFTEFLIRYRWIFVVPVLLPLSTVFNLFWGFRNFYRRLFSAPERHGERVRKIQERIQRWHTRGRKGRLCTARPPWMSISTRMVRYKGPDNSIPVDLYDVLEI